MSDIKFWIPSIKTYEDGFQHPTMTEIKGDGFISFNDYAKLKTQVEFLTLLQAETLSERNKAEAEVERLQSDLQMEKENEDRLVREWQKANNEVERLRAFATRTIIPNEELQAQVERLTKAGDAIYQSFDQFGQVDAKTLKRWLTAKEGKDAQ